MPHEKETAFMLEKLPELFQACPSVKKLSET